MGAARGDMLTTGTGAGGRDGSATRGGKEAPAPRESGSPWPKFWGGDAEEEKDEVPLCAKVIDIAFLSHLFDSPVSPIRAKPYWEAST